MPPLLCLALSDNDHVCVWTGAFSSPGAANLGAGVWSAWSLSATSGEVCADATLAGWDSFAAMLASGELALGLGPLSEAAQAALGDAAGREELGLFGVYLGLDGEEGTNVAYARALALDGDATLAVDDAGAPLGVIPEDGGFVSPVFVYAEPLDGVDATALLP